MFVGRGMRERAAVFRRARRAAKCRRLHFSPRRPQVKCHQTAFRNIWNDLYGAKESVWGAGRGAARPWDSGARASRTPPTPAPLAAPHRAAPPPAFQRASLRIYSAATQRTSGSIQATPGLYHLSTSARLGYTLFSSSRRTKIEDQFFNFNTNRW